MGIPKSIWEVRNRNSDLGMSQIRFGTKSRLVYNMAKESLKTFYQTCGRKPERVLYYRDGVSEGQFAEVLKIELTAIKGTFTCRSSFFR